MSEADVTACSASSAAKEASASVSGKKKASSLDPESVDAVLSRIKQVSGARTIQELAAVLNITPKALVNARKSGMIPHHCITFMTDWMRINPNWLLEGKEPVFRLENGMDCPFQEMMQDPEICPVVVPVYRPQYFNFEDGGRPENFPYQRKVLLPRATVPKGLLVFEEEPEPKVSPDKYRSALIGVDTTVKEIRLESTFAFFCQQRVVFWHVGPAWTSGRLNRQRSYEELDDLFPSQCAPFSFASEILGRVIWRFESIWHPDLNPKKRLLARAD